MNTDCLKLTIYLRERDRVAGRFLADILTGIYARHRLQTSLLLRGIEGFGLGHYLRTDRLLTLSEDLPLVSVAVDAREAIEAILPEVEQLRFDGLVTLERAAMVTGPSPPGELLSVPHDEMKLTVYLGRHERSGRRPAYETLVDLLHERGVAGATVLLGVDGTSRGIRQRARFFATNSRVPLMVIAVGEARTLASAVSEIGALLPRSLITLERVRVCKRDGHRLAEPEPLPATDPAGLGVWQKLMVYSGEQTSTRDGHPLHRQLVRALRGAGAAGATSLRGIWGYHGSHAPHGDTLWQLRRRVPVVTVIVDTPDRIQTSFALVDQLTQGSGLVTSEMVPAFRATGPSVSQGGLKLARLDGL